MISADSSSSAAPPGTENVKPSANSILSGSSSGREGTSTGRSPTRSVRSATRAARFADRTEAKVAPARTSVPPAVASEEIVTQSAIPLAVQVDPDRDVLGADRAHQRVVHRPAEHPQAGLHVLVLEDVRGAAAPRAPHLHADARVLADVLHVGGRVAVLGDDPELVAAQAVAQRHAPRLSALPPGGLEEGVRLGEQASLEQA